MRRFEDEDLTGVEFRECDLSRARLVGVVMRDAEIDGLVTNLVVNGVEVTLRHLVFVHDSWFRRCVLGLASPFVPDQERQGLGPYARGRRVRDCLGTVVDEEWAHHGCCVRDLDKLPGGRVPAASRAPIGGGNTGRRARRPGWPAADAWGAAGAVPRYVQPT
jgi:hypothetical protein